jgi:hypothetical protein
MTVKEELEETKLINAELLFEIDEARKILDKLANALKRTIVILKYDRVLTLDAGNSLKEYQFFLEKYPNETI